LAKIASINRHIVAIRTNRFIAILIPLDDTMIRVDEKLNRSSFWRNGKRG